MSPLHYINVYTHTWGQSLLHMIVTILGLKQAGLKPPSPLPHSLPFPFPHFSRFGHGHLLQWMELHMQKYSWILVKEPNTTYYQCFFFLGKYSHFFNVENKKDFCAKKLPVIHQSLEKKQNSASPDFYNKFQQVAKL